MKCTNFLFFICLFAFVLCGQAQQKKQDFVFSCIVKDSALSLPISDASIYIYDVERGTIITTLFTDSLGTCTSLIKTEAKSINFEIYAPGFKKFHRRVDLAGKSDISLGTLFLASNITVLKSIHIKKEKAVTFNGNEMSFNISSVPNVENMPTLEVLDYLPFLSFEDEKKQLKLMGEPLTILINDNPHPFYSNPSNLNALPSQAIDRIEVKLVPTARMGNARVMNITLKKHYFLGWRGNINTSVSRLSANSTASISYWKNNLGFDFSANGVLSNIDSKTDWTNSNADDVSITQDISNLVKGATASLYGSIFYNVDSLQTVDLQIGYNPSYFKTSKESNIEYRKSSLPEFQTGNYRDNRSTPGIFTQINYTKKFQKPGRKLFILSQFLNTPSTSSFNSTIESKSIAQLISMVETSQTIRSQEYSVEAVVVDQITKSLNLTVGSKLINRQNKSEVSSMERYYQPVDSSILKNGEFKYTQSVFSVYADLDFTISRKLVLHTGAKLETVHSRFKQPAKLTQKQFNLLPNISLSFSPDGSNSFSLTYTRDTRRPDFAYSLVGFNIIQNPYASDSGNMSLRPQFTNRFNFQYYGSLKNFRYGLSLGYSAIRNFVDDFFVTSDSGSLIKTFANSKFETFDVSLNFDFPITKKIQFSHFTSASFVENKGLSYRNLRLSGYIEDKLFYNLSKNQRLTISVVAFSPNVTVQGRSQSNDYWNTRIGYSHFFTLFKNSPSMLGLSILNPWLYKGLPSYELQKGVDFSFYSRSYKANPFVGIQFAINIKGKEHGGRNFDRSKSIQNNDLLKSE